MLTLETRDQVMIQKKLQKAMAERGIDVLLLHEVTDVFYATGHYSHFQRICTVPGYTLAIVPPEGECIVVCPDYEAQGVPLACKDVKLEISITGIYIDQLETMTGQEAPKERPSTVDGNTTFRHAMEMILDIKPDATIGIQGKTLTPSPLSVIKEMGKECQFVDCSELLERVKAIKTPWEVDVLRAAAQMTERAMNETAALAHVGMTEAELHNAYFIHGMQQNPYVNTVLPTCSLGRYFSPFVIPRNVKFESGDLIRFDCGVNYLGYVSDICRNFSVEYAKDENKRRFAALIAGYERMMELIGPGVKIAEVFNEGVRAVKENGLPEYLRGHMGHSIGVEVCVEEWPYISPSAGDAVFEPGMVLSVEAPYNNPLVGGMAPEDTIVITEDGYELFTHTPKELVVVGA